ncbi:hypothetical protein L1987_06486 [Smallanthus sonchifolius]|uniref:Uncharacterized protein n=1 Tax=Smallanthus sonchifolius TaxID=185202 RepID=A0ACB9JYG2_9ASTR|nr:hypothetical protein L1987_06486 [Smallanthus sonchifolius]
MVGWLYWSRLHRNGRDLPGQNVLMEKGDCRELNCAMKICSSNPTVIVSFLWSSVGGGGVMNSWVGIILCLVRFWGGFGSGLGMANNTFFSSVESSIGEVGSNIVAWGVGFEVWARYSVRLPVKVLWRHGRLHRIWTCRPTRGMLEPGFFCPSSRSPLHHGCGIWSPGGMMWTVEGIKFLNPTTAHRTVFRDKWGMLAALMNWTITQGSWAKGEYFF